MKQDVIISIRHPFAEKIYSGEKLYEFRKRRPNIAVGTRCWIYEPLPIGKVTGFFIYRGCYRDEKAKVWEHCQETAGINREAFMQYYDRDFYAHAWQVGKARRCPAFDLKDACIDRAPQSYISWSSEFLENLIITMNERKELNDKLRDLILEIRGKKGFAAYRVGNGWLSMSELIKDDGKLLVIKPWEPDSHSQRIHITLKVSPGALESTKEGWDLLQFVKYRASSALIQLMKGRGARAAVVCEKGSLTAISDEVIKIDVPVGQGIAIPAYRVDIEDYQVIGYHESTTRKATYNVYEQEAVANYVANAINKGEIIPYMKEIDHTYPEN